jgi:phosphonoacetate hydrolase
LAWISQSGFAVTADVAMPTFTNPNNCSIITGAPTAIHGIAGNFYLEPSTGEEKLVLDDSLLRGSTILEQMSLRGVRVAAVTAKDKLRRIIQHGLSAKRGDICFSSEYANQCTLGDNGITDVEAYVGRPAPPQYSGDLSLFVLDAGIKLLRDNCADLFYLTLSDYVQHKHAPGSKEANDFLMALDEKIGQLIQLGAVVGITGDHGMSDKSLQDGSPNILFVQEELEKRYGPKCARVICPITDPFVRHHGALGSFVRIHINSNLKHRREEMLVLLRTFPQVQVALIGEEAAARWEMPLDREADIVVVSIENAVLGSKKAEHDLNQLKGHRLRSHGGLSEQAVPLMMSNKGKAGLAEEKGARHWRNFDVFDLILNCVEEAA